MLKALRWISTPLALAGVVCCSGSSVQAQGHDTVEAVGPAVRSAALRSALLDLTIDPADPASRAPYQGRLQTSAGARGAAAVYFDDFSSYPRSTDPIFARFQINMQGLENPEYGTWDFSQSWYIPTLCIEDQFDDSDPPKPDLLPRWQGAELVENPGLGILVADINSDGVVDTADLGLLIGSFGASGAPGFSAADLNEDGVVDTADLGLLLGEFGQSNGPFCVYFVDEVHAVDTDGLPLDPSTIAAGPALSSQVAVINNGTYTNDADADGCPDCAFFRIDPVGGAAGELVYGTWSLLESEEPVLFADFAADVIGDDCAGWGDEGCMCDARGETDIIENACCFLGARVYTPWFLATEDNPLALDFDVFLTDLSTFQWIDSYSSIEGVTTGRLFIGGYALSLTADFLQFAAPSGFLEHFIVLGPRDGVSNVGDFYGTRPNVFTGATGIKIKTGEWFTVRMVIKPNELQYWISDSETRALADPMPGDNGDATPFDGADDIEDGFAKIYPIGPFGSPTGSNTGGPPPIPSPVLAAVSLSGVRFLWSGDPTNSQVSDFKPRNVCYDNIVISGELLELEEAPAFKLDYLDDIESYTAGSPAALLGGRWIDLSPSLASVDDSVSASGSQSIRHSVLNASGRFQDEVRTVLPLASANTAPWTAGVSIALSGMNTVRSIALIDDEPFANDVPEDAVARLLTGVENENGLVVVDGMGRSTIHLRVPNPGFNPAIEPDDSAQPDAAPEAPPVNSQYLNVPTDALWEDANVFHRFTFEVDASMQLVVHRDSTLISPDPALAPLVGYTASGWPAGSVAVDEMRFECGNQAGSFGSSFWIDDVTLDGFEPEIAAGPPFALPYADDFEDYPVNAPIDGQGDTPFVETTTLVDVNLCIEQGAQALNAAPSDTGDWCEYQIKSDAVGGIESPNDWGLSDGDSIFIKQADCDGLVACKQLPCFTNPNRPDEFIPNAGLFDDPVAGVKAPSGARIEFVAQRTAFDPPDLPGVCNTFAWDTYEPGNIYCRYTVNSIDDADPETPGQQDIATPSIAANQVFYASVGGKLIVGGTVAVDQVYAIDSETGESDCPGIIGAETDFKVLDPCGETILSGTWTAIAEAAAPLDCGDTPHFAFVHEFYDRYRDSDRVAEVLDDPTGSGRGNILSDFNDDGFNEYGETLFTGFLSTYPAAYATASDDCVFELDCYVADLKTRYTIDLNGPLGTITQLQLGGEDIDLENSPGEVAIPTTNFSLLENNAASGGPFGMGPAQWFWDTGTAVPVSAWFRLRVTVADGGVYTIEMDQSGVPGGDGVFETTISTLGAGSPVSGFSLDFGADAIDGFDTRSGIDSGGDGVFTRGPLELTQDGTLPGAHVFPDEFCFYEINDIDGILLGLPPAPCNGVFGLGDLLGVLRDAALPNWPNGGVAENCPESPRFIWNDQAMTGQCLGDWRWLDRDNPLDFDFPETAFDVDSWGVYTVIPPYTDPGPASQWYFDNITLDGSPIE